MPVLEMANDVAATRRSLRRRRAMVIAAAFGAVVFFLIAANSMVAGDRTSSLQHDGLAVAGSVVSVEPRPIGHGLPPNGFLVVRYPVDGELRDQKIWVGSSVSRFAAGQAVDLLVDPTDSGRVAVAGISANRSAPIGPVFVLGLLLVGMAYVSGRHLRAINKVLRWERWAVVPARLIHHESWAGTRRAHVLLVLETVDSEIAVEPIGFNRLDPGFEPNAWVAGLGSRRMVVAQPGGGHVLLVMPVRTA